MPFNIASYTTSVEKSKIQRMTRIFFKIVRISAFFTARPLAGVLLLIYALEVFLEQCSVSCKKQNHHKLCSFEHFSLALPRFLRFSLHRYECCHEKTSVLASRKRLRFTRSPRERLRLTRSFLLVTILCFTCMFSSRSLILDYTSGWLPICEKDLSNISAANLKARKDVGLGGWSITRRI